MFSPLCFPVHQCPLWNQLHTFPPNANAKSISTRPCILPQLLLLNVILHSRVGSQSNTPPVSFLNENYLTLLDNVCNEVKVRFDRGQRKRTLDRCVKAVCPKHCKNCILDTLPLFGFVPEGLNPQLPCTPWCK